MDIGAGINLPLLTSGGSGVDPLFLGAGQATGFPGSVSFDRGASSLLGGLDSFFQTPYQIHMGRHYNVPGYNLDGVITGGFRRQSGVPGIYGWQSASEVAGLAASTADPGFSGSLVRAAGALAGIVGSANLNPAAIKTQFNKMQLKPLRNGSGPTEPPSDNDAKGGEIANDVVKDADF